MTRTSLRATDPLPGYKRLAYGHASLFGADGDTTSLEPRLKLSANDASLTYEPHHSDAFGAGFQVGFFGPLTHIWKSARAD